MEGLALDVKFVGMPSLGGFAECNHCQKLVPFPEVDTWLAVDGRLIAGTLEAFLCPTCHGIVDVRSEHPAGPAPSIGLDALHLDLSER